MIAKEQGSDQSIDASEEIIYKIDIPANRYDLLCLESLSIGLLIFLNKYCTLCVFLVLILLFKYFIHNLIYKILFFFLNSIPIPHYEALKPKTKMEKIVMNPEV